MKVLEFETQKPADGTLLVPPGIAAQIPDDNPVRVVLLVGEPTEDEDWRRMTMERFFAGYSESDAIYDEL